MAEPKSIENREINVTFWDNILDCTVLFITTFKILGLTV